MAGGFIAFRCSNYDTTAEREQFRLLCEKMKTRFAESDSFYLMIGNYNIYDCEFDAIIIKQDAIIAIEFKNYGGNIVTCENGNWTSNGIEIKGGSRKTVYQQARANHAALRKGLNELGINQQWIKNIPTIVVFNQTISLDNQLSRKVRSWLHITDNAHFIDKIEDITCVSTNISNLDIIDLAIKLNLNPFLNQELSSYSVEYRKETEVKSGSINAQRNACRTLIDGRNDLTHKAQIESVTPIESYDRFTPNHIFSLRPNQVFVFGTDRRGSQRYGAAGLAANKFGAKVGVIDGPTGNCYALPTKGFCICDLEKAVKRFIDYVNDNNQFTFLVTPVGCGHAGFELPIVANMFKSLINNKNVMLPEAFVKEYQAKAIKDTTTPQIEEEILETGSDYFEDILNHYDERLHDVVRFLLTHGIEFNIEDGFVVQDESGAVIAEAELGVVSEKAVFFPFNSQSERAFKNNGFTIWTPSDYLQSKAK